MINIYTFSVREELDHSLLTEVLGITSDNVLESMQTLRYMLWVEPSIHGGKKSKCDLDAELAGLSGRELLFRVGPMVNPVVTITYFNHSNSDSFYLDYAA